MSTRGLLLQWSNTINIQLSVDTIIILSQVNCSRHDIAEKCGVKQ